MTDPRETRLKRTPLYDLHLESGAKMVGFAGYEMPVHYASGIIAEHLHTRAEASLFDVSHMGQVAVRGDDAAAALETLVPADIIGLAPGHMRYTMLTDDRGGILEDLMVTNSGDGLFLVLNAARKADDIARLEAALGPGHEVEELRDLSLLALQGPAAVKAIASIAPGAERLDFMSSAKFEIDGHPLTVARCGYTGEDGFEISLPSAAAADMARRLLAADAVEPAGLGARDSLRLEAGLCLYGHDIDETTTPVEAGLQWSIAKRRRLHGGFPGAAIIAEQIADGPKRRRVGIAPDGRAPAREHTQVTDSDGGAIGEITSGGYSPTLAGPVAMGYVEAASAAPDTAVHVVVRGKPLAARVHRLPFVPHRYHRS